MRPHPILFAVAAYSAALILALVPAPSIVRADDPEAEPERDREDVDTIVVTAPRTQTATSSFTVPASSFDLRPLESGGQMLEAVPGLVTAQHTGGGKAEQYFLRGFDADHGTDLAIYFDGVPINLRSHAHGQGFLDLHFVTKETIDRLDAEKGPYWARYGDFATAATIEYVPYAELAESFLKVEGGEFDTLRTVAAFSPRWGPFRSGGPGRGFVSFEAYRTDGPFNDDEGLERFSGLARGSLDLGTDLTLSGHLLGYYGSWNASGLIPDDGPLSSRWGSLDPSEGGRSTRAQGKVQVDWVPWEDGHLMANAYLAYYDLTLYSNFTYFLENDDPRGDGIVQQDHDRIYTGGRVELTHVLDDALPFGIGGRIRGGIETRYDHVEVLLGTQTRRGSSGCQRDFAEDPALPCNDDRVRELSVEPYVELHVAPAPWIDVDLGLRVAWFRFAGHDRVANEERDPSHDSAWLPKANVALRPFAGNGILPSEIEPLRELEIFGNFGIGYHSNDARAVFADASEKTLPTALGGEVGVRTRFFDRLDVAVDWWILELDDEFVFVGDEGTTESSGDSVRQGVELATTMWITDWLYLRGDVAYTSARLDDGDVPIPQAPRFVAKGSTGVRLDGFAAELNVRHLGERYATEDSPDLRLSDYTVFDFAARYRWSFLEVGVAVENLTDTKWRSSEFYYESRPLQGGPASEDFHYTPGNPRNFRGWITGYF